MENTNEQAITERTIAVGDEVTDQFGNRAVVSYVNPDGGDELVTLKFADGSLEILTGSEYREQTTGEVHRS